MTMKSTPNQGFPYPDVDEDLSRVAHWLYDLAQAAEEHGVQRFADAADMSSKRPSPSAGEFAYLEDAQTVHVFDGTTWQRVYPPSPTIFTGSSAPSSSLGSPGDIYLQTG